MGVFIWEISAKMSNDHFERDKMKIERASVLIIILLLTFGGLLEARSGHDEGQGKNGLVKDLNPVGKWRSIDFVRKIEKFKPGKKIFRGDLFLKDLEFMKNGRTSRIWTWENGRLWNPAEKVKSQYLIKQIDGVSYMFMEWGVGQKPWSYYVLEKVSGREPAQVSESVTGIIALAQDFIQSLAAGDYSKATKIFDPAMKNAVPPDKLGQIWESLCTEHGPVREIVSYQKLKYNQFDIIVVSCEFEKSVVDLQVSFNPREQIAGFHLGHVRPVGDRQLPAYVNPDSFEEKEIKIGSGQWILPGTLTLPKGPGPFPALVLVHGSGPHDRDESLGPNKPFRDLAGGLAGYGVAVLRYEKRTKAFAQQIAAIMNTLTVKEETIDDALAGVNLLRQTEQIDAQRIYLLGHSLGGMVIPRMGKLDPNIAGFIILAGTARPLEDIILDQFAYIFSLDGKLTDAKRANLEKLKQQVANVKDPTLSEATSASELPLGIPAVYWLDLRGYKPADAAKDLSQPMLILQGGRDYQVTKADYKLWKDALSLKKNVTFKWYENLNHLFIRGKGKSVPGEYNNSGYVDKTVIRDISKWIQKQGNTKN